MFVIRNLKKCAKQTNFIRSTNSNIVRLLNYTNLEYGHDPNPATLFFNTEIQSLLKSLTRADLNKVYTKRKLGGQELEKPIYKFMTNEQLQESLREAKERVEELLQMPPVVPIRKPIEKIISEDPEIQGFETCKMLFTDITFGLRDSDRLIVVRETNGTLKEASWEIRDRMNQIYFPRECRRLNVPRMFQDEYLEKLLSKGEYIFILDRACIQFEPNHPEYHRITSVTYECINSNNDFNKLRSTRHFGPMAFYLTWFKKIDNLLWEIIETKHIEDANNLLLLYEKIHNVQFNIKDTQSLDGITKYIAQEAQKKGPLELALQAYKEFNKQQKELQQGIKAAHGYSAT